MQMEAPIVSLNDSRFVLKEPHFEVISSCWTGEYVYLPEKESPHHDWELCLPTHFICAICQECRDKPPESQCVFQYVAQCVEWLFPKCCQYFKMHMFRGIMSGRYRSLKLNYKESRCPFAMALPYDCKHFDPITVSPLQHIVEFHGHQLATINWFSCYKLENATYAIYYMGEIFIYVKRLILDKLRVYVVRFGLVAQDFQYKVSTWRYLQYNYREEHAFSVGFLHECSNNLVSQNKMFVANLMELYPFIHLETLTIRLGIEITPVGMPEIALKIT